MKAQILAAFCAAALALGCTPGEPQPSGPAEPTCDELMPPSLGAGVQVRVPSPDPGGCWFPPGNIEGTSDRRGTFALMTERPIATPVANFAVIHEGVALLVGANSTRCDFARSSCLVMPQASGFLTFFQSPSDGSAYLWADSSEGVLTRSEDLNRESCLAGRPDCLASTMAAADPSSGTAIIRTWYDPATPAEPFSEYRRYGADGAPESDWIELSRGRTALVHGVTHSGNVLVIFGDHWSAGQTRTLVREGRWYDRSGVPITDWFPLHLPASSTAVNQARASSFSREMQAIAPDQLFLVLGAGDPAIQAALFTDGRPGADEPPSWLRERAGAEFFEISGGRALAARDSAWCPGSLEILTRSGRSCGCLSGAGLPTAAPNVRPAVGRDGSVIVGNHEAVDSHCPYRVYPRLLQ